MKMQNNCFGRYNVLLLVRCSCNCSYNAVAVTNQRFMLHYFDMKQLLRNFAFDADLLHFLFNRIPLIR